jgi:hypothetical protein
MLSRSAHKVRDAGPLPAAKMRGDGLPEDQRRTLVTAVLTRPRLPQARVTRRARSGRLSVCFLTRPKQGCR